jgi:ribosomal protein S27E
MIQLMMMMMMTTTMMMMIMMMMKMMMVMTMYLYISCGECADLTYVSSGPSRCRTCRGAGRGSRAAAGVTNVRSAAKQCTSAFDELEAAQGCDEEIGAFA